MGISFKGTDSTFLEFPERLRHVISETVANVIVESVVFPAYEVSAARACQNIITMSLKSLRRKANW